MSYQPLLGTLVMERLGSYKFKQEKTDGMFGQYRFSGNPLRAGSNSKGFVLTIHNNGMYGCYIDHGPSGESGSLWDLAQELGISYQFERKGATKTKVAYQGLADYAKAHGLEAADLEAAKWQECVHFDRPALRYPTASGNRIRYIDGDEEKTKYTNEHNGYKACWYGLKPALKLLNEGMALNLVLCNGEISTLSGHKQGMAAMCVTGGEKGNLPENLLAELKAVYPGGDLILALDCDYAGINSTFGLIDQLEAAGISTRYADLGFDKGGDLADFCRLFGKKSEEELQVRATPGKMVIKEASPIISFEDASEKVGQQLRGEIPVKQPIPLPFKNLRQFGGMGRLWFPGRAGIIGADTGTGKTIFLETWIDYLRILGIHCAVWSPEWIAEEQVYRSIHRAGGPSMAAMMEHEAYEQAIKEGLPENKIFCEPLHPDVVDKAETLRLKVTNRPGKLTIVKGRRNSAENVIDGFEKAIKEGENNGEPISVCFIDYMQRMRPDTKDFRNDSMAINESFSMFCDLLTRFQVTGGATSQVVKNDGKNALGGGNSLGMHSMQYLRTDEANFVLCLTRQINAMGNYTNLADADITKNNLGRLGKTKLEFVPGRMLWQDAEIVPVPESLK